MSSFLSKKMSLYILTSLHAFLSYPSVIATKNVKIYSSSSHRTRTHNSNKELPKFMLHKKYSINNRKRKRRMVEREGNTCDDPHWSLIGFDIDGKAEDDRLGYAIDISADGNVLVVGSPFHTSVNGYASGQIRVFRRNSTTTLGWVQLGDDLNGEDPMDIAGRSVAISGNGEIIAYGSINHVGKGAIHIFQRNSSSLRGWVQLGHTLTGNENGDQAGYAVALSWDGTIVAFSAPYSDRMGFQSGQVHIFERDVTSPLGWTQIGEPIHGGYYDRVGISIALSSNGEVVAVGAGDVNDAHIGYVSVYQRDSTSPNGWVQQGRDIIGEGSGDGAGSSVALSSNGETVAVGSSGNDGNGDQSGHVRIFQRDAISTPLGWVQVGENIEGEATGDRSGHAVSLSSNGQTVAIGAIQNDGSGYRSGHVRVLERDPTSILGWSQIGHDIDGEASGDRCGYSVALSANGHVVATGAIYNRDNGINSGHVRVFETCKNKSCDHGRKLAVPCCAASDCHPHRDCAVKGWKCRCVRGKCRRRRKDCKRYGRQMEKWSCPEGKECTTRYDPDCEPKKWGVCRKVVG